MSQRKRGILGFVLAAAFLGIAGCGGGGSSTNSDKNLPQTSTAPTVTFDGWAPNDAQLTQYKSYAFSASATDPNIGGAITEFQWDFGDGTKVTTPAVLVGGKASATYSYAYSAAASMTLSVVAKNGAGLLSKAATHAFTITAAASPLSVAFTTPAGPTTINPAPSSAYPLTYQIQVTNTGSGTIAPSGVVLDPGEATATVGTPVDLGGGSWSIVATYLGTSKGDSRTVTPSVKVRDSNSATSAPLTGPVVTIKTVSSTNVAPVLNLTLPATDNTVSWTSKPFSLGFTLSDADNDPVSYKVVWGDEKVGDPAPPFILAAGTDFVAGVPVTVSHTYADAFTATSKGVTILVTAFDNRDTVTQKRLVNVTFNARPTTKIDTPQSSGTQPAPGTVKGVTIPAGPTDPDVIVIPLGGSLIFDGTFTLPSSADAVTTKWTFPGGSPSSSDQPHPGQVSFQGELGKITANLVTFTATDLYGRASGVRDSGLATGGSTTSLVDTTKAWSADQWVGFYVRIASGTGAGQLRKIVSNTTNTVNWIDVANPPVIPHDIAPDTSSNYLIELNPKAYMKWVLVDGTQTQFFNLSFLYRKRSDTGVADDFSYAVSAANGLGVPIQIFQDGLSNTYPVTDTAKAKVSIPVRSNLPFWVSIPKFGSDFGYILRIPNQPGVDTGLGNTLPDVSKGTLFGFANSSAPYNPTLQIVTAAGFANESDPTDQRRIQGTIDLYNNGTCDGHFQPNLRWMDRLSVPLNDPLGANSQFVQSANNVGAFSGLKGYQSFGEWWISLKAGETMDFNTYTYDTNPAIPLPPDPDRRKAATGGLKTVSSPNDMGFIIDSTKYNADSQTSEHFSITGIQAYRAPKSTNDPYDFDTLSNRLPDSRLLDTNPTPLDPTATSFLQNILTSSPGNAALHGGLRSIPVSYNANDVDRKPYNPALYDPFMHRTSFAFAEYLWSKAFARPLVLNRTSASWWDTAHGTLVPGVVESYLGTVLPNGRITLPCTNPPVDTDVNLPKFFYSAPGAAWPKLSNIFPNNISFDLTVSESGTFDASVSPLISNGTPGTKGVGRFFWTAFNPNYNAAPGALISRTWQAGGTYHFPVSFGDTTATDPVSAWGFIPPQDTMVDKRGRDGKGLLNGQNLGGYRIQWFNPTTDVNSDVVAPDFWVVELVANSNTFHFLLPGGYPTGAGNQNVSDPILTDARRFLPSQNTPTVGAKSDGSDTVGPGYCWFDVPLELRPVAGSSATVTIYALRSVLKTQPGYRAINRPEWIESIKTATASISVKPGGIDVSQGHKVPFNYPWDVVVVNGPATSVAP